MSDQQQIDVSKLAHEIAAELAPRIAEMVGLMPRLRYNCTGAGYTCSSTEGYSCSAFGGGHSCTGIFVCSGQFVHIN
jgi:hypothetical protein